MKKFAVVALPVILATVVWVSPASANTFDRCRDSVAPYRCVAKTTEQRVDAAIFHTGKFTHGWARLTCVKGQDISMTRFYMRPGRRTRVIELSGNPDCTARLIAVANKVRAGGSVRLIGG